MRIYIRCMYGGQELISVEECCAAELRSIDLYLANSDKTLLKAMEKLEELDKDKIESKNEYNKE